MSEAPAPRKSPWVLAGQLTAVAFEFVGFIGGGAIVGHLSDRWLGTEPWLLILLTVFGTCAGFYQMIRMLRVIDKHV